MRVHVQSSRVYQSPLRVMPYSMWSVCSVAWRLREIFVFAPDGIFVIYIYIYIFFLHLSFSEHSLINNTLGRGAPAALRPPWRPSVPVPTRRLFYPFVINKLRLFQVFEPFTYNI